eukprot:1194694-Prorocentrum_minimum.AAC.10
MRVRGYIYYELETNITSFYGSSCAVNNGKDALSTPEILKRSSATPPGLAHLQDEVQFGDIGRVHAEAEAGVI